MITKESCSIAMKSLRQEQIFHDHGDAAGIFDVLNPKFPGLIPGHFAQPMRDPIHSYVHGSRVMDKYVGRHRERALTEAGCETRTRRHAAQHGVPSARGAGWLISPPDAPAAARVAGGLRCQVDVPVPAHVVGDRPPVREPRLQDLHHVLPGFVA